MLKDAPVVSTEELLAKAKQPAADAMRLHPFYHGKVQTALRCRVRDFNDFAIWYTPGCGRTLQSHSGQSRVGVRAHAQMEHGRDRVGRHARAGPGRHRPQSRPAGDGRQSAAVQISGRRGRLADHAGHQRPGQDHRYGVDHSAGLRRRESGRHLAAQMLPRAGHAARARRDSDLA